MDPDIGKENSTFFSRLAVRGIRRHSTVSESIRDPFAIKKALNLAVLLVCEVPRPGQASGTWTFSTHVQHVGSSNHPSSTPVAV